MEKTAYPCPIVSNHMQTKKGNGREVTTSEERLLATFFFYKYLPEAVFLWESTHPTLFQKLLQSKCWWHIAAALCHSIPLCCTFMGFCSRVFCCQKPWVRVVKLNPFNNNGHSLKTSAYFYSIVCNILNLRITTALCWCHQEEVLL